jgi:hypothetical protein
VRSVTVGGKEGVCQARSVVSRFPAPHRA